MNSNESKRTVSRPVVPQGYGIPENNEGLLPWSYVEEHMAAAKNYWIITADRQARPAASPVWAAWVEGRLYFDGSPETRRSRNIQRNPQVCIHLESGSEVLILEGEAVLFTKAPERSLAEKVSAVYRAKYAQDGYSPAPDQWDEAGGGLCVFTPQRVMAWSQFPTDMTRWVISS